VCFIKKKETDTHSIASISLTKEGPLLSSAWAGWKSFDSEVEVVAVKNLQCCQPELSSSFLRWTRAAEEEDYDVMYSFTQLS
jgi:hypothetical protein